MSMKTSVVPPPLKSFVRPCSTCGQLVDTDEGDASKVKCQGCDAWVHGEMRGEGLSYTQKAGVSVVPPKREE